MITLNNLVFENKTLNQPDQQSMLFQNGVHNFDYTQKSVFDFLAFADSQLLQGEIKIDDSVIFPKRDKDISISIFAITSSSFCLTACFKGPKENNKVFVKEISNQIFALKSIVPKDDKQVFEKLDKLLVILKNYGLSYLLLDFNEKNNAANRPIILECLKKYESTLICFLLAENKQPQLIEGAANEKPKESEESLVKTPRSDFEETTYNKEAENRSFPSKSKEEHDLNTIKGLFLHNLGNLSFIVFSTLFATLFLAIFPYFFNPHPEVDVFMGVIVLIVGIICFVISLLMILDLLADLRRRIYKTPLFLILFAEVSIALGIGLGFLALYLFRRFNFLVDIAQYRWSYDLVSLLLIPVYLAIPPLNNMIFRGLSFFKDKIAKVFKKK